MADMIRTILVPATGNPTDSITLDAALTIARAFSAHIDVLHVRVDPLDVAVTADGLGASIIDQIMREAEEREAAVKRLFGDFCAREKLPILAVPATGNETPASAQWHVETGNDARSVVAFGMFADLILAARGNENDVTSRTVLEAAFWRPEVRC